MPRALSKTATMPEAPQLPLEPLTVRIPVAVQLTGIGRSKLYELIAAGEVGQIGKHDATFLSVSIPSKIPSDTVNCNEFDRMRVDAPVVKNL